MRVSSVFLLATLFVSSPIHAASSADAVREERKRLDASLWAQEVEAQHYEQTFVRLWDKLLAGQDVYEGLAEFPFETIKIGTPSAPVDHGNGVQVSVLGEPFQTLDRDGFKKWLESMKKAGFRLGDTEWHHTKFRRMEGRGPQSDMNMLLLVENDERGERYVVKGDLLIDWTGKNDADGYGIPQTIDTKGVKITYWKAPAAFKETLNAPQQNYVTGSKDYPVVLVYDLDGDGLSEVVLPMTNSLYRNDGKDLVAEKIWPDASAPNVSAGLIADLNADGHPDLLCSVKPRPIGPPVKGEVFTQATLTVFDGNGRGFSETGRPIFTSKELLSPEGLTAGDVDGDGDLDLFIGQIKRPYVGGHMPTPFYDANDAFPWYFLRNDGDGEFTDVTEEAGLAAKRNRRVNSASLVDLNDDGALDLLVANDFAGADVFYNDGKGKFANVTDKAVDERRAFGMGLTFGDYDLDGRLDFYMAGMGSTTARRLEDMKLARNDRPDITDNRMPMGYGNRMYLAKGDGTYAQPSFKDSVSRGGWAWGETSFDFDSDGDVDIFVGNGHSGRKTTKDYCTVFWTKDVYLDTPGPDPQMAHLFQEENAGISWDGYQHNKLFMNKDGKDFIDMGFLAGVALQENTHAAVSDDLNADGRPDLVMSAHTAMKEAFDRLRVFTNEWPKGNHWIGVRLKDEPGLPAVGARITVSTAKGPRVARIIAGDSYRSQHSNLRHFGLGELSEVDSIEVRWPGGKTVKLDKPAVDRYHDIRSA